MRMIRLACCHKAFLEPTKKPLDADYGDLSLQALAASSGRLAVNASDDVASLIQKITQGAEPLYTLSFVPPARDKPNEFHPVEIKVNKPDVSAHTRWGHYTKQ